MGLEFPKSVKIGGREIGLQRLKWFVFYGCLVLGLVALLCIILYVEVYIHSFSVRVDCNPDLPLNYQKCLDRGCIWVQKTEPHQPLCFHPEGYGYAMKEARRTSNGYHVDLERRGRRTLFGREVDLLSLHVFFETPKRLRLKFADKAKKRFEVPLEVPLPPSEGAQDADYGVEFVDDPQFGIRVKRNSTGTVIFDTNVPGTILSEQYNQISTLLASANVYGFGEHSADAYRHSVDWKKLSLFARDTGTYSPSNLYGVHPFYMNVEENGDTHGVFLLNSNAMEVIFQPTPALTFRTLGGILDFYLFLGPTPEDVVEQYLEVIGRPMMPPYWSLGFHLSRYGFATLEDVETVTQRTIDAQIPYDVQHFDIDYMNHYKDFTFDEDRYQGFPSFVDDLHRKGRRAIVILDPAIASNKTLEGNYEPLDEGIHRDIFVKLNGSYLEGMVWPGKTYYPDFTHPEVRLYWSHLCTEFRKLVKYDGIWLDMNEPSNFMEGSLTGCAKNSLNYPPYAAGVLGSEVDGKLFEKTLCMDADHYIGKHYDLHSLYGYFQANVTYKTLATIMQGRRPMILSRSTFAGSGRFTAHWLGDNLSTWRHLRQSIPGVLQFNTFGIPFVGSDICGFGMNATEELCLRWMQLGAFYPFSRNHNAIGSKDQDPASFGESFVLTVNRALLTRYELLPYLYTLFHQAHTSGSTVARPLLHEFPDDPKTWDLSYQFLWGPALMISPFLYEGISTVDVYFPRGTWYDFYKGNVVFAGRGSLLTLEDEGTINLHVRGGHILPLQAPNVTTELSRKQPMGLYVAPDENDAAAGTLFWDDGESLESQEQNTYLFLNLTFRKDANKFVLTSNVVANNYPDASSLNFGYLTVCNQPRPSNLIFNGQTLSTKKWTYDPKNKVLRLKELSVAVAKDFTLTVN